VAENLLRDEWANLDQADLRALLHERIGGLGQYDHYDRASNILYLPLALEKCRVSLTYKGSKIVAIEPGTAFDRAEWDRICTELETSILVGPRKVGRDFSFSTFRVEGWWRGIKSGVQILPPPDGVPRERNADDPFILEFPIQEAGLSSITNERRKREHRRLTLLLNLLLAGTTKFVPDRHRHLWANVRPDGAPVIKWVIEYYFAELGEAVISDLSPPSGEKLEELDGESYLDVGQDGLGLRVPDDLDDLLFRYQNLSATQRGKFDRATYWMSMASRQWEDSMSASFASLVSSVEALTEDSAKHNVYCEKCKKDRSHDVPGATEKFRAFFERYAPSPGLSKRRNKMYEMRSSILHGSALMKLDQDRASGWDPPWWNEFKLHTELWSLVRIAARNWLKNPPADAV